MALTLLSKSRAMEMDQTGRLVAKKLWNVLRIAVCMVKTGMSKTRFMFDLNLVLKRSNKAITNLFFDQHHHHGHGDGSLYSSLTCRSDSDVISSAITLEYEFSCSNSPAYPFAAMYQHHKRKHNRQLTALKLAGNGYDNVSTAPAVQKVLEMLSGNDNNDVGIITSPSTVVFPAASARQLRVTDSPFPVKEEEEKGDGDMVDKAAEEFIKRFYKDLRLQRKMAAALESPYHDMWGR